jgi:peptidoglycan/xylan/chitin deacetylase (PgdA/CDA1 family)
MPLSELGRRLREGRLRADAAAITFDDAYASALRTGAPLLKRYGLTATVYLPADLVDRGKPFWWDELAAIVLAFEGKVLRWRGSDVPMPPPDLRDRIWEAGAGPSTPRQQLFQSLWSELRTSKPAEVDAAMAELRAENRSDEHGADAPMSTSGLRGLPLIEYGSHALTHPSLPALDDKQKHDEIEGSRRRCADLTGKLPLTFAYPYGDRDAASVRLVQESGYTCAVTTDDEFVTRQSDPFALPRIAVGNWRADQLRDRLRGL